MVTIPILFYVPFPFPVPHTANLTVSSTKPFNLSCLGAYILPNEQVVWMYQNSTFHVEIPYVDFQSTMTNELVFVETNLFASGRYTCHSVDTGEVLSDYQVTFVPGEDCLQLSGPFTYSTSRTYHSKILLLYIASHTA